MLIRSYVAADREPVTTLTIETFRAFYLDHVRPAFGERLFRHQHGAWEQDYVDLVPTLHDPAAGKHVAVAEIDEAVVGYVGWSVEHAKRHGMIDILAVDGAHRRNALGRELCRHALDAMRDDGVDVAGVFTGGDDSHLPARALYESLGGLRVDIAGYLIDLGDHAAG